MSVRRLTRIAGTLMLLAGVAVLAWVLVVWRWQDPFTAAYTHWKQHQLSESYKHRFAEYRPAPAARAATVSVPVATVRKTIAQEARQYRIHSERGQAIGRIQVPRLGLNMVLVNGTDHDSLTKGPGRDRRSYMPGEGQLVYIAGHRTTYLAPFAHIERLRSGDPVTLEVPYGTFRYRVFKHRVVDANDLAVLRSHGREVVELQACHPRFFATQRYIAYARLTRVEPRGGSAFEPPATALAAAPLAAQQG
jgi:sortase A